MLSFGRRLARNLKHKAVGETSRIATALLFALAARHYGPDGFGAFTFAFSIAFLAIAVSDLGLNVLASRAVARDPRNAAAVAGGFFWLKMASVGVVLSAAAACAGRYPLIALLLAALSLKTLLEFFGGLFTGLERIEYEAGLRLLSQGGLLALGIWVMRNDGSLARLAGTLAFAYGGAVVLAWWWFRPFGSFGPPRVSAETWSLVRREGAALIVMTAGLATLHRMDATLLGVLGRSDAEIGRYAAASWIIDALQILPALVTRAAFPIFSSLEPRDPEYAAMLGALVRRFAAITAVLVGVLLVSGARILTLVFGAEFAAAGPFLAALTLTIPFFFLNWTFLTSLVSADASRAAAAAAAAAWVCNAVLDLALIPGRGALGAAYATLAAQILLCAVSAFAVKGVLERGRARTPEESAA